MSDLMDLRPTRQPGDVAVVDANPFDDEALECPADFAPLWLDAGPIFWLSSVGAYGVARHAELTAVHRDWQHFSNSDGIGLCPKPEHAARSLLLEADPPEHTHSRQIMNPLFTPAALQPLIPAWRAEADALVGSLVDRSRFDAMVDLALPYATKIVPREIGLAEYPTERLHSGLDAIYPFNSRGQAARDDPFLGEALEWMDEHSQSDRLAPGRWGAAVHAAAERGECTHAKAGVLVRSLIAAGVFNTVLAIGNMINALVEHPEEWRRLREDPSLARNAVEEVMRWDPPGIHFFRTISTETSFGGAVLPPGAKVLMQFVAANRDPRRWDDPNRFDITRRAGGHFGFGMGIHQCLGQTAARQQLLAVLEALLERASTLTFAAPPVRKLSNLSHGFKSLPVDVVRA